MKSLSELASTCILSSAITFEDRLKLMYTIAQDSDINIAFCCVSSLQQESYQYRMSEHFRRYFNLWAKVTKHQMAMHLKGLSKQCDMYSIFFIGTRGGLDVMFLKQSIRFKCYTVYHDAQTHQDFHEVDCSNASWYCSPDLVPITVTLDDYLHNVLPYCRGVMNVIEVASGLKKKETQSV